MVPPAPAVAGSAADASVGASRRFDSDGSPVRSEASLSVARASERDVVSEGVAGERVEGSSVGSEDVAETSGALGAADAAGPWSVGEGGPSPPRLTRGAGWFARSVALVTLAAGTSGRSAASLSATGVASATNAFASSASASGHAAVRETGVGSTEGSPLASGADESRVSARSRREASDVTPRAFGLSDRSKPSSGRSTTRESERLRSAVGVGFGTGDASALASRPEDGAAAAYVPSPETRARSVSGD